MYVSAFLLADLCSDAAVALSEGQARLSKDEAKAMKRYVYHQQLLCRPEVQSDVLSKMDILRPEAALASDSVIRPEEPGTSKRMKL